MKLIALLVLATGCSSIHQRHDFLTAPAAERVCGKSNQQQNAVIVNFENETFVVQSKSVSGLYLSGFFFAPIFPWHSTGSKDNIFRVYTAKDFSPQTILDLKAWTIASNDQIHTPAKVEISQKEGTIGTFAYTQVAELSFERQHWGNDFTLAMELSGESKAISYTRDQHWSYQWMFHEVLDPQCVSR